MPGINGFIIMNRKFLGLAFAVLASVIQSAHANIVGYVNLTFQTGANWFANPLNAGNDSLSSIMPTAPDGTTVSLWNTAANQFTTTSTFSGGAWSDNFVLDPGTGALLNAPSQFVSTFTGSVENFDGTPPGTGGGVDINFTEPPVFSGVNGIYFFGSKAPLALSGNIFQNTAPSSYSVFLSILGRAPHEGEQFTTLNAATQTYTTTTFTGGAWNNGVPTLAIGQAGMFNLGPVPEPSSIVLLLAGVASVFALRRRQVAKA